MRSLIASVLLIVAIAQIGLCGQHPMPDPTRYLPAGVRVPNLPNVETSQSNSERVRLERRRIVEQYLRNGEVPTGYALTVRPSEPSVLLVELVVQSWVTNAWVNMWRYYYYYNAGGLLTEERYEQWNGSAWANFERYLYTYLVGSLVSQELWQRWNGSIWLDAYRYTHTYTKSGLRSTTVSESWIGTMWQNSTRDVYTYDLSNLLIERLFDLWQGSAWVTFERGQYTYSGALLTQVLIQYYFAMTWTNAYMISSVYNLNNLLVESIFQTWVANAWENYFRATMTYNVNNKMDEEISESWTANAWKLYWRRLFVYGLKALIIEELEQEWIENSARGTVHASMDTGWVDQSRNSYTYTSPTGVGEQQYAPVEFSLGQNYPNPFNPSTTFRMVLAKAERATLRVFDLLGRTVATLIDDQLLPLGETTISWSASGLPSGVYTYQFTAGDRRETRKMVLAR